MLQRDTQQKKKKKHILRNFLHINVVQLFASTSPVPHQAYFIRSMFYFTVVFK